MKRRVTAAPDDSWSVIEPTGRASIAAGLRDLLRHRDLLRILVRRDVAVRFTQAVFGFGWALVQPLVMVLAFSLFLHNGARLSSGSLPYPVFALTGLVPWTFFQNAVSFGSDSLVNNEKLVS